MKKICNASFIIICLSANLAFGQSSVTDVNIITTSFKQVEIIRMQSGTDLLEGLNSAVKQKNIKNAVILSGIGSVTDYHYHVVSSKDLPPDQEYPKASVAMDLTSVQGYILNGKVHVHITLSDENSMVGGHLEPGTKALTFFILTLGILPDDIQLEGMDSYRY
jgi:predicted DNA-binding protein with PD1-like motif